MNATNHEQFINMFNAAKPVEFNVEFNNDTGYFNALTESQYRHNTSMISDNGRKVLVLPISHTEALVVFERYTNSETLAFNYPHPMGGSPAAKELFNRIGCRPLRINDEYTLDQLLSDWTESVKVGKATLTVS